MSLLGKRLPAVAEWEKYDLGHRVRVSIKPGIMGLRQATVSATNEQKHVYHHMFIVFRDISIA